MHFAQGRFAVGKTQTGQHRLRQAFRHRAAQGFEKIEDRLSLPARGSRAPPSDS